MRCAGSILRRFPRAGFPVWRLARQALQAGGAQPCALNAADEVAVAAFLERRLAFPGIARVIERVLERMPRVALRAIEDVIAADGEARRLAREEVGTPRASAAAGREVETHAREDTSVLTGIIAVVLGLGLMVLIHEFGHFIVARFFGVRVDVFSFGLGPRLFGVKRGATDYRLSALPMGGYVRMAGENPSDERTGDPDEFLSKPRWQRMFIVLAGPTTNLLLAVALDGCAFRPRRRAADLFRTAGGNRRRDEGFARRRRLAFSRAIASFRSPAPKIPPGTASPWNWRCPLPAAANPWSSSDRASESLSA